MTDCTDERSRNRGASMSDHVSGIKDSLNISFIIQNAINLLEKKYAIELEKSFQMNEKIKSQIESCDSINLQELSTAYASETKLYFQREKELEMLKKAFLQQEEDFKIHIAKLKRLKHWNSKYFS